MVHQHLRGTVCLAGGPAEWLPRVDEVVGWLVDSPLVGQAEAVFKERYPRRRWELARTGFLAQVGSAKGRLYSGATQWQKFLVDAGTGSRDATIEFASVGGRIDGVAIVGVNVTVADTYPYFCHIGLHVQLWPEFLDLAESFTSAAAEFLREGLERYGAVAAGASWQPDTNPELDWGVEAWTRNVTPAVWGYRMIQFIPAPLIDDLGGVDRVVAEAPVRKVQVIRRNGELAGLLALLVDEPAELDVPVLRAWRDYLRPVMTLPMEGDLNRSGGGLSRPYDILPEDWWPRNPPHAWPGDGDTSPAP